jgi:RHS repeat-associated protein
MGIRTRLLSKILAGTLLLTALAGCGKSSTPHGDAGGPGNVGGDGGPGDGGPGDGGPGEQVSLPGPPLDPTVPTSFSDAVSFIYSGENPVQTGVAPGAIDDRRVVVLRGHVRTREGQPVKGARVTVVGAPEFGMTETRVDGWFDLAVNGGGVVKVNIAAPGYFSVQRQAFTPWRDWVVLPEVVLTPVDPHVTAINPGGSSFQVAKGGVVTDSDGTRQAVILFPPGTTAEAVLPDGGTQTLAMMHVRATEYTVGPDGPAAMPAALPPTSAYTYAAELSVDEAEEIGASSVRFNSPVIGYVDNFLQFPSGTPVPVGFYDRKAGVWVPAPDGQVVKLLSVTGGLADLDLDGDGLAETGSNLSKAGITDGERATLAANYGAEARSLWRFTTSHFTPCDLNFPPGPPPDADYPPDAPPAKDNDPNPDPDCSSGSIIECENQALGEAIPIAGTAFSLRYRNDKGATDTGGTRLVLTDASYPASLLEIQVRITGAGRVYEEHFAPSPNLSYYFKWDGIDAYGRSSPGEMPFKAEVIYAFPAVTGRPMPVLQSGATPGDGGTVGSFGQMAVGILGNSRSNRGFWALSRTYTFTAGRYVPPQLEFGRWTLDVHHRYQLDRNIIFRGDGRILQPIDLRSGAQLILGGGTTRPAEGLAGRDVDLMPDLGFTQIIPTLAVGPDGTIYVTISARATVDSKPITRIWGLKPDGKLRLVAGHDDPSIVLTRDLVARDRDDIPATETTFQHILSITSAPDGSLYVVQFGMQDSSIIVRRIGPDGIIRHVAGKRGGGGESFDFGPAVEAALSDPGLGLGTDAWGNVYIPDAEHHRIRRVDPAGNISTFAFNGLPSTDVTGRFTAERQPARLVSMSHPANLRVAQDGTMYVTGAVGQIVRIATDGLAASLGGFLGVPGLPETPCDNVHSGCNVQYLDLEPNQDVTFTGLLGSLPFVRRVSQRGAVSGVTALTPDCILQGGPAVVTCASGNGMWGLAHLSTGELLIGTSFERLLKIAVRPFENSVPSDDGSEIFVFDSTGRHLKTLHARTLTTKYEFQYDSNGLLSAIVDGSANKTTFERNSDGRLTAFVSPFGIRTEVSFDAAGNLLDVLDAAGNRTSFVSEPDGGLLTQMTDPRGGLHQFAYDATGRLTKDVNPAGETVELLREDRSVLNDFRVTKKTALGRTTTYDMTLSAGVRRRVTTDPAGLVDTTTWGTDASTTSVAPDGVSTTILQGPDPRFGMISPKVRSSVTKTPGGLTRTVTSTTQIVEAASPAGPFDFASSTQALSMNGRVTTTTFDSAARQWTFRSPLGRETRLLVDALERPVEQRSPGVLPVTFTYDARGRLNSLKQGDRTWTYRYDASSGFLTEIVDPLGRVRSSRLDPIGRPVELSLPGGRTVNFTLDGSSNVQSLVVPGGQTHAFTFTPSDRLSTYSPPRAGGSSQDYAYTYDLDGAMTSTALPDGRSVRTEYDSAGRPASVQTDRTLVQIQYASGSGQLVRLVDALAAGTSPSGSSLEFAYDGPLLTGVRWTGAVQGNVSYAYTPEFLLASTTVAGAPSVANTYDDDFLLTKINVGGAAASTLILTRDAQNGAITSTSIGMVGTTQSYDPYGVASAVSTQVGAATLYSSALTYDAVGRLQQRVETVQGTTNTYLYSYDDADRLTSLEIDGAPAGEWTYDGNGNRLTATALGAPGTTVNATYDAQDRLVTFGAASYQFGPHGDLRSKTSGGQTTTYVYDSVGALSAVTIPTGERIDYVLDALGRRVGRKVNGTFQQGWLYDGMRPIAEIDATGTVVARFVYGTRSHVPDLIWKATGLYRVITDERGSPRLVINASTGAVAQRLDYDVWGNVVLDSAPGFQPFGFVGGLYDASTHLTRFGARDYDAETGRWVNKDPASFAGGDTNLYVYAGNDPVNLIDPSGLSWVDWEVPQELVDYSAAFGSTLSFGLTDVVNELTGASSVINKCSGAYSAGKWSGVGLSAAFGVAHLGRNALNVGLGRILHDPRTWRTVRGEWSLAEGGGVPWLKANGVSLHHWLVPQSWFELNAGFNYMPISAGLNSFMNGATTLRTAVQAGFTSTVLGIYGAPLTALGN